MKKYRWLKYIAALFIAPLILKGLDKELGPIDSNWPCTSCHSMKPFFEEYKTSVHYFGRSGVKAGCVNCHVKGGSLVSVSGATLLIKDTYKEIFKPVKNREDAEARRPEMAKRVRDHLIETRSGVCFGCHVEDAINPTKDRGKNAHESMKEKGKTCIECHFNLVHAKVPWEKEKKKEEAGGDELDGGNAEPEEEEL